MDSLNGDCSDGYNVRDPKCAKRESMGSQGVRTESAAAIHRIKLAGIERLDSGGAMDGVDPLRRGSNRRLRTQFNWLSRRERLWSMRSRISLAISELTS